MGSTSRNLGNLAPNADFAHGKVGEIPDDWRLRSPKRSLEPIFRLARHQGRRTVLATGAGNPNCVGWLASSFSIQRGKTYKFSTRFQMSGDVDPHTNLLFVFFHPEFNHGIFDFTRQEDSIIEGESRFFLPGSGEMRGEVWILFRYCARGKVWIHDIQLEECPPVMPRRVKIACTSGLTSMDGWARVLDRVGNEGVDLVLLPESIAGPSEGEAPDGLSPTLMSEKAAQYRMHVAGGFLLRNAESDLVYNVCALFDRSGKLIGMYRKNHLYVTEILGGIMPGAEVPVFDTDFGRLGMIICYDGFFTDVIELQSLKGAEIILFPNAGYYRSLMPARAADNGVRVVVSSWSDGFGIWDTSGYEVTGGNPDTSRACNCGDMFTDVKTAVVEGAPVFACDSRGIRETDGRMEILFATLDLNTSAAPHHRTGPMSSGPGGHRNCRGQRNRLLDDIKREHAQW